MSTQELINKEVEALPEPLQREIYDFARFLRLKSNGVTCSCCRKLARFDVTFATQTSWAYPLFHG
jgi:hypothetical protein